MKIKSKVCRLTAFVLCACLMLVTYGGAFWGLFSLFVRAVDHPYIVGWKLTGSDGSTSEANYYYMASGTYTDPIKLSGERAFNSQEDIDRFIDYFKTEYTFALNSEQADTTLSSSWNTIEVANLERRESLDDGRSQIFEIILVNYEKDTFHWKNNVECHFYIAVDRPWEEGDADIEHQLVTQWCLIENGSTYNGSSIEAPNVWSAGYDRVTLPDVVRLDDEDAREAYASTILEKYNQIAVKQNRDPYQNYHEDNVFQILEIVYDAAKTASENAAVVYRAVILGHAFYSANDGSEIKFYIIVNQSNDSGNTDTTYPVDARLKGTNTNNNNARTTRFYVSDPNAFANGADYAARIPDLYAIEIFYNNNSTKEYKIQSAALDAALTGTGISDDGRRLKVYKLTLVDGDELHWQNETESITFYLYVYENGSYNDARDARLYGNNTYYPESDYRDDRTNAFSVVDRTAFGAPEAYIETIKNSYRLEIYRNNLGWQQYTIQGVEYDKESSTDDKLVYKLLLDDIFYWQNDQSKPITFYLYVYEKNVYNNARDSYLHGKNGSINPDNNLDWDNTNNKFIIIDPEAFKGTPGAYAETILDLYDKIYLYITGSNITDRWVPSDIIGAEYVENISTDNVWAYELQIADVFYWQNDPSTPITFYLYVYKDAPISGVRSVRLIVPGGIGGIYFPNENQEDLGNSTFEQSSWSAFEDPNAFAEKIPYLYRIAINRSDPKKWEELNIEQAVLTSSSDDLLVYQLILENSYEWLSGRGHDGAVVIELKISRAQNNLPSGGFYRWGLVDTSKTPATAVNSPKNGAVTVFVEERLTSDLEMRLFANELLKKYTWVRVSSPIDKNNDINIYYTSEITKIEYSQTKSDEFSKEYGQDVAVYEVSIVDAFRWADDVNPDEGRAGEIMKYYIVVYDSIETEELANFFVSPNEPEGVKMNLFDYWIVTGDSSDETGNPWEHPSDYGSQKVFESDPRYDGGINKGHMLKFFYEGFSSPWNAFGNTNHNGLWNHSTVNEQENQKELVKKTLVDGYPELNLNQTSDDQHPYWNYGGSTGSGLRSTGDREESLAYLFDPSFDHDGKKSYEGVKGLLQMNQDGYYYYDSKLNFAEFNSKKNSFNLYNTWGVEPGGESPDGQFFPFNTANQVFSGVFGTDPITNEKRLVGLKQLMKDGNGIDSRNTAYFNHYFGFTMEVDFQQPMNGQISHGSADPVDMTFKFAGDDDIWVFVDGVLVLDLGGVHSGVYGEINFATGEVITGLMKSSKDAKGAEMADDKQWSSTTLFALFKDAMEESVYEWAWNNNNTTFADNTAHTIQLFYMERGHWDSNFAMYFNLQPYIPNKLYKVSEDGDPLEDAQFTLYAATPKAGFDESKPYHTASEFALNPELLAALTTQKDGYVIIDEIDFATLAKTKNQKYYILSETKAPAGYRQLPKDIILEYNAAKNVFTVLNQYEVGAYASFSAILKDFNSKLDYALPQFNEKGQLVSIGSREISISDDHQVNALMFAVPMIYTDIGDGENWYPMYGSNTDGYNIVNIYKPDDYYDSDEFEAGKSEEETWQSACRWALRHNLLAAALRQVADTNAPDWYFHYRTVSNTSGDASDSLVQFSATLENLPGEADRYLINDPNGNGSADMYGTDLQLVGLLVDAASLASFIGGVTTDDIRAMDTDHEKYQALKDYLQDSNFEGKWDAHYNSKDGTIDWGELKETLEKAYVPEDGSDGKNFERGVNLAYIETFTRTYGSVIYVPNERRELRVLKQDITGNGLRNATFGLFKRFEDAANWDPTGKTAYKDVEGLLTWGVTDSSGLLIFSIDGAPEGDPSSKTGYAYIDWNEFDSDSGDILWVRELSAPNGYRINDSIVQVYVGNLSIYANASAYKAVANDSGGYTAQLIDDNLSGKSVEELQNGSYTDGVFVMASLGKLFQSMEKFADPLLNSTLLDIDAHDNLCFWKNPDYVNIDWTETGRSVSMHFWDELLKNTSSEYSQKHKTHDPWVYSDTFSTTQNGFIWLRPQQTGESQFKLNHAGENGTLNSRRDDLTGVEISGVFSPVNVIVVQDDPLGLTIEKRVTDNGNKNMPFAFEIELSLPTSADINADYHYLDAEGKECVFRFDENRTCKISFNLKHGESVTFVDLPEGTSYTVKETGLNGYVLSIIETNPDNGIETNVDEKTASGTIVDENAAYVITFVNAPVRDYPSTGGIGTAIFYVMGGMMILCAGAWLVFAGKKNKAEG